MEKLKFSSIRNHYFLVQIVKAIWYLFTLSLTIIGESTICSTFQCNIWTIYRKIANSGRGCNWFLWSFAAAPIWGRLLIEGSYYFKFPKLREIRTTNYVKLGQKIDFLALKQLKTSRYGSYLRAAIIESDTTFTAAPIQGRLLIKGGYN